MSEEKKSKKEFNRALINDYLPFELLVFYKLREYAMMQGLGQLDVINLLMFIEGLSEAEAFEECIKVLKLCNRKYANIVSFVQDVTTRDVDLDIDHFRKN
jgi:hypothetical protein